ncbi:hypothetical protein M427DRAFT_45337 [Gonapodya prolifera JEL478]|uniref:Uncharacterized protein n=1 Tax=Gonapodya prolifera (strain JEL478) TaxID=1344416 RepID=A0A139AAJ3_GONPJ|nr:hypothetical protein M427DRAFT_45337 [Gonapodya prolifera JEL478]|eukprot:KXS13816.1 hypothetical protein M427DRAFT_45337 [Gonapodya prolifera JEL478]
MSLQTKTQTLHYEAIGIDCCWDTTTTRHLVDEARRLCHAVYMTKIGWQPGHGNPVNNVIVGHRQRAPGVSSVAAGIAHPIEGKVDIKWYTTCSPAVPEHVGAAAHGGSGPRGGGLVMDMLFRLMDMYMSIFGVSVLVTERGSPRRREVLGHDPNEVVVLVDEYKKTVVSVEV